MNDAEIEERFHKRFAEQLKAKRDAKFPHFDRDYELEDVWVAYAWTPDDPADPSKGEWTLAGFRRKRRRRKPQTMNRFFSKVRRGLGVHKATPVMLLDLKTAMRRVQRGETAWRYRPPQFQVRKPKIKITKPALLTKRGKKFRAKGRTVRFPKATQYIVLGRNPWDRAEGHLYLGPLASDKKRSAQFEARRLYPIYKELLVISVTELSKPLLNALRRGKRMVAGATRIVWPEVPPTFDQMWDKAVRRLVRREFDDAIAVDDPGLLDAKADLLQVWNNAGCPWLTTQWFTKHFNSWRGKCEPKRRKARKSQRSAPKTKRKVTTRSSRSTSSDRRSVSGKRSTVTIKTTVPLLNLLRIVAILPPVGQRKR